MALFPEARAAVEAAAHLTPMWTDGYDVAAARDANRALALQEQPEDVAEVVDLDADGVRVRLFRPAGADPGLRRAPARRRLRLPRRRRARPAVPAAREPARHGGAERRLPAGRPSTGSRPRPTTSTRCSRWLDREARELGLGGPTYVHGDSAGGNLALVAALRHPGRFRGGGAALPVPRPDRPASSPTRSAPPRLRPARGARGTGSSTPPARRT